MAVREIKTTLAVDGEKAFNKAVTEAGRNMRVMASEMKAAASDFNLTGDEMEYLGRKSRSLNEQIRQQEAIIQALESAVRDSAEAYGDASAKTDGYRIKLNNANAALSKLKKELEESDREMTELGRDAGRVGRQLEEGIGEAAEDVSRKFDQMANMLDKDISSIKSTLSISAGFDVGRTIAEGAGEAYEALTGLVDQSMDYNRTMSFLQANAAAAGHDFQQIKQYAIEVAGITGDMDAAVEGMSNLLAAGLEPDELADAVTRLSAAVIKFPDTLKFESLADSLQESIATGSAVGQYAEYLERMGVELDTVNKSLEEAGKKGTEAVESAALSWLSDPGSLAAFEQWKIDNEEMRGYFEAQATLTDAQANLAKELTPLATAAMDAATLLFDSATAATKEAKALWERWKAIQEQGGLFKENETVTEGRKENLPTWDDINPGYETGAEKEGTGTGEAMIDSISESIMHNAPELPTWDDFAPGYEIGAETTGKNIAIAISDGIDLNAEYPVTSIKNMMAAMQTEASKGITVPVYQSNRRLPMTTGTSYAGAQTTNVTLDLDGRTLGKTTVEYNSDSLGAAIDRIETYG